MSALSNPLAAMLYSTCPLDTIEHRYIPESQLVYDRTAVALALSVILTLNMLLMLRMKMQVYSPSHILHELIASCQNGWADCKDVAKSITEQAERGCATIEQCANAMVDYALNRYNQTAQRLMAILDDFHGNSIAVNAPAIQQSSPKMPEPNCEHFEVGRSYVVVGRS
ncbi:hypothetical protein AC578_5853 [Pseudocercospora eumusae]|uniref:Uncharacterized protein n=1 Tax=Pseudocercospora eumusae TaxID=321146 RepID=A0A139GXR2_9PEZI|nr:hypothetical protein AC578_5853 [Pseudocercospora eumusae]